MAPHNARISLRIATADDAAALLEIYAPYVAETAISFEYVPPSETAFRARIETTLAAYPYLVAERDGVILGYAYTSRFHPRAAYDWDAETSIYVRRDVRGLGLGRKLYTALEAISKQQGIQNLYACIAYAEPEDEHLTNASPRFHERMGYTLVSRFSRCAFKFGRWYDMIWMEKSLGVHPAPPAPFRPFPALDQLGLHAAGLDG